MTAITSSVAVVSVPLRLSGLAVVSLVPLGLSVPVADFLVFGRLPSVSFLPVRLMVSSVVSFLPNRFSMIAAANPRHGAVFCMDGSTIIFSFGIFGAWFSM